MGGLHFVAPVCLGRYYPLVPPDLIARRWYPPGPLLEQCPAFRCSCSSKIWFYLVKRSTAVTRVYTCLSRADGRDSSLWMLLVVAIDRVSTMQLFVWEALTMTYKFSQPSHRWHQLMMLKKSPMSHKYLRIQNSTYTTQKRRPCREHRCGVSQVPSEGQVRTSYNSRVLEMGELCVPWLVRVLGLLW